VALQDIATNVLAELEPLAEAKGVELRFGPRADAARVTGQATALHTLARNLVDNALRYTPPGGRVNVETKIEGQHVVLEVTDTGPGIPAEERERVFDRFYRLPGTNVQGSGLGLAIIKQIADAHRATIELGDPGEGRGLRVTVRFPLAG
jgi:two-component system OmpR family sensor kinase